MFYSYQIKFKKIDESIYLFSVFNEVGGVDREWRMTLLVIMIFIYFLLIVCRSL